MNIFDTLTIRIKFHEPHDAVMAIATLNFNEQLEIRFAPIKWKENKTRIFFDMPALKIFGYQKCAVVLKVDEFNSLKDLVISKFIEKAKEYYHPDEFKRIESALNSEKEEIVNPEDIPPLTTI
jgi:hypothetical protein